MKNSQGVSLIIAVIFVSAFMLVLGGLAEVQLSTIRSIGLRRASAKIQDLAMSAEEIGRAAADSHGPGWNSVDDATLLDILNQSAERTGSALESLSLSVIGRSTQQISLNGSPYFSVPAAYVDGGGMARATGDAGECAAGNADANNACHWNRLYVGENVEIPLYYEGNETPNFGGAGANFSLRIRPPCDTDGFKDEVGCARIELFPLTNGPAYRDIKKDPVLVQWTISGIEAGESKTLIARDQKDNQDKQKRHINLKENNTEFSAGKINAATTGVIDPNLFDSIVLQKDFKGAVVAVKKPLVPEPQIGQFLNGQLSSPVLRLSLVTQPTKASVAGDDDGDPFDPSQDANDHKYFIPFLEYQLLTKEEVPSDSKSTISGIIESPEFRREFQVYRKHATTLGGFVLESL